jgi:drug/metabolite transporter (DMT)-like permease
LAVGVFLGLLAALCQSVATLMIKPMMAAGMDAIAASAVRTSASFLAHAALWWAGAHVAQMQQRMTLKTAFHTWASATIAMGVGMTLILQALKTGPANLVGLFSSLSPVLLLPLLWGVYRRRPALGAWCGAAMAVLGSALILRG